MNAWQKEQIARLRAEGQSYNSIADIMGLSINTVKSYCRRANLGGNATTMSESADGTYCGQCGARLKQTLGKRRKRFCSDQCRMAWWNTHPEAIQRKAIYTFICAHCQEPFESYGNRDRKFCSRACYGKSKVRDE